MDRVLQTFRPAFATYSTRLDKTYASIETEREERNAEKNSLTITGCTGYGSTTASKCKSNRNGHSSTLVALKSLNRS